MAFVLNGKEVSKMPKLFSRGGWYPKGHRVGNKLYNRARKETDWISKSGKTFSHSTGRSTGTFKDGVGYGRYHRERFHEYGKKPRR